LYILEYREIELFFLMASIPPPNFKQYYQMKGAIMGKNILETVAIGIEMDLINISKKGVEIEFSKKQEPQHGKRWTLEDRHRKIWLTELCRNWILFKIVVQFWIINYSV